MINVVLRLIIFESRVSTERIKLFGGRSIDRRAANLFGRTNRVDAIG